MHNVAVNALSLSIVLLVTFTHLGASYAKSPKNCSHQCAIVRRCRSTVLTCGGVSTSTDVTLSFVECTKINDVFLIGTKSPAVAQYLDPEIFPLLGEDGMRSVIFGTAVNHLTRHALHKISPSQQILLTLNTYFLWSVTPLALETYNIDLSLYNSSRLLTYTDLKKESTILAERHCDSKYSPCICKYFYHLQNPHIDVLSFFYNESSSVVCQSLYPGRCVQRNCTIPRRDRYTEIINRLRVSEVQSDDYCAHACDMHITVTVIVIGLWSVFILNAIK